ncbi:MAG: hypothetical protein AB7F66_14190 [Bacteriovoracia bacterium]
MRTISLKSSRYGILSMALVLFGCETEQFFAELPSSTPRDPNTVVCDPLGPGSSPLSNGHGMKASLRYLSDSMPQYQYVAEHLEHGILVEGVDIYFNNLFVPTRMFDSGFETLAGGVLKNNHDDTLFEWFSLNINSYLRLRMEDAPGNYEFALLADDGAVLSGDFGLGYEQLVVNDGTHPTRMGCGAHPVALDHNSNIPITIDYFQGPRYHIALTMLWRRHQPNATEPLCGASGNSLFFDPAQSINGNYAPQAAYNALLSRGWTPVPAENLYLGEDSNPCL